MRSEHNVTNMRNLILILLLFWGEVAHSQLFIQKDEALWKTHKMMSKNKLSAIGLYANTDDNLKQANLSMFLAKEEKTNKWGVMTNLEGGDYFNCRFILSPIYDSITELAPDSDVLFLRKNNTFGFVYIFEDVEFFENGIPKEIDFFDEVKIDIEDVKKTAYVRKGGNGEYIDIMKIGSFFHVSITPLKKFQKYQKPFLKLKVYTTIILGKRSLE